jgi:hypothetical protein
VRAERIVAAVLALSASTPAFAHRLDEYLQATIFSIGKDRVHAQIRLAPGVAVSGPVLAGIDRNGDGALSPDELSSYAERVLADTSLRVDGDPVPVRVVSSTAAGVEEMREGRGEIRLEVEADAPRARGPHRLRFESHHQRPIAAYLVNTLVPSDPGLRITAQARSEDQSVYELDYEDTGAGPDPGPSGRGGRIAGWLGVAALVLFARIALPRRAAVLRVS